MLNIIIKNEINKNKEIVFRAHDKENELLRLGFVYKKKR